MKKPLPIAVLTFVLSSYSAAWAQAPAQTPVPGTPGAAPAIPAEVPPPPSDTGAPPIEATPAGAPNLQLAVPPDPLEPAPPTIEDRLSNVEAKTGGLEESLSATKAIADRLAKIKFSGYIQGRFEYRADALNGVSGPKNRFLVRRSRLKAVYDGTNAEYVLQIDATPEAVALRDAEATFVDTWTPFGLRLTVGQFKWTFGYEVLQSSGDREMPERATMIRRLFPGERDRGMRLQGKYEWFRFAGAVVNGVKEWPAGTETQASIYGVNEQNSFKDLVARVGADFEWLVFGVSGYFGRVLKTGAAATTVRWTDTNKDKLTTLDEVTFTETKAATYEQFSRKRVGADMQLYFDVPGLGGLAIKGEIIYAKDTSTAYQGKPADSCQDLTSFGGIVTVVQNIGDSMGAVLRYDSFDPNFSKALDARCAAQKTAGLGDRVDTIGGGLLVYGSGNIKGTFIYEHIAEQAVARKNDVFTAQLQARF